MVLWDYWIGVGIVFLILAILLVISLYTKNNKLGKLIDRVINFIKTIFVD